MGLLNNSNAIESGGYNIDCSLRFRSSASAYLNRTPASTSNRKTWTWSGWVKRGAFATGTIFTAKNGATYDEIRFSDNTIRLFLNGATSADVVTTPVYRDPSAWYHLVIILDTTQSTAANRIQILVNGVQVTALSTAIYPSQNYDGTFNNNTQHAIGYSIQNLGLYFDGYLAEVNFIDGQALTPSSFGEFSTETGVWVPKKYTGTYGTNGFYLDFKTNTSATTLAYDKSGNGNNWTANNISTTAGATYDSMTDVPTPYADGGTGRGNYCVMNAVKKNSAVTLTDGNLYISSSSGAYPSFGSIVMDEVNGWYAEFTIVSNDGNLGPVIGVADASTNESTQQNVYVTKGVAYRRDGSVYKDNAFVIGSMTALTNGAILSVAYKAGKVWFAINGTWQNSGNPAAGTGPCATASTPIDGYTFATNGYSGAQVAANFGQRPFAYTPPTGFKSLNTFNLPDPVIKKPNQYMDATTYTGNGGTQSIVNAAGFQPDLVWAKCRSSPSDHALYDSVRGIYQDLASSTTGAETTQTTGLISFNANGFTTGSYSKLNASGPTYVGWQWKKGATPGFDIVTYTGTGVARTVSHNLGVAPKMIIVKQRSGVSNWETYHTSLGAAYYVVLDGTNAQINSTVVWNNTSPTSSVFSLGAGGNNASGQTYVAYLFAEIPGFSKFGSYTGNGSTDGPFVYCGFRPKYVLIKNASQAYDWYIHDTARDTYNAMNKELYPNASGAEVASSRVFDALSNGFKVRDSNAGINASGNTYIYAAFAENPFKYSNAR